MLPDAERSRFAVAAIADALNARLRQADTRLVEPSFADADPEQEPEREDEEFRALIEAGLDDIDAGRDLVSFEEACRRWEAEKAARQIARRAGAGQSQEAAGPTL